MLKQVYEIDELGHIKEIFIKEFDEQGNCLDDLMENIIDVDPPQGLYRAKWTGAEWIETLTQEEIAALNNITKNSTTEEKIAQMAEQLLKTQTELESAQQALDFIIMGGI